MARLFDTGIFSVNSSAGAIGVGYKLYFYTTGTSTPKNTYPTRADAVAGTNANANPMVAASDGRFDPIWLTDGDYKVILKDFDDVTLETRDPGDDDVSGRLASTTSGLGADLVGLTGHSGYTVLDASLLPGNTSSAGSLMKIDWEKESSNTYPTENEGSIWSADTYAFLAISAEMTSSTVPAPGDGTLTGGPLCAIFAFANNNNSGGDVVAFLGSTVARTNDDVAFGANFIARNVSGTTGTKLVGLEVDVVPATGTTVGSGTAGIIANIFNIATSAPVLQAGAVGSGTWGNGILTSAITGAHYAVESSNTTTSVSFIDPRNGTYSSAAVRLGKTASQGISVGGDAFGTSPYLFADSSNNLVAAMGSTNAIQIQNLSGTAIANILSLNGGAVMEFVTESSADAAAPSSNGARLYTKDNGAGKTQLAVRFATGAVQIIATEP